MTDLFDVYTVHCFACPHVERALTPETAHDQMERHYRADHARLIAELVNPITKGRPTR